MRKIEDFETFAAGYFLGLGIKKPTVRRCAQLLHVHRPLRAVETANA